MMALRQNHTLFLVLLLHFTETEQVSPVFVRDGDDVTLTCDNVQDEQDKCNGTTWRYTSASSREPTVELISLGQIGSRVEDKDRVSVTEACSLEIKHIRTQEAGQYVCRQYDQSRRQLPPDASVNLSVVSLTAAERGGEVKLLCSVSTQLHCSDVQVKWVHRRNELTKGHSELKYETSDDCRASVSFKNSHYLHSRHEWFNCEVSYLHLKPPFTFRPEEVESTTKKRTTNQRIKEQDISDTARTRNKLTAATEDRSETGRDTGLQGWWWAVGGAVALTALITAAVVVFKQKRNTAKPQNLNCDKPADPEEGVSYASISFTKMIHGKNRSRGGEEEAVTYSSVKTPASEDPAHLYTTVNELRN